MTESINNSIFTNFLYNNLSWKTFLSSVAKDIKENNGISSWSIYGKYQLAFTRPLIEKDLLYISNFDSFSSFYVMPEDLSILSKTYSISKSKEKDIIIPIENFSLVGNRYSQIRTSVNKNKNNGYTILDNFIKYEDILECLIRWDDTCGEKKFQSRVGKNKYFFKNNFHKDGICIFLYDKDKLISFGILSKPDQYGTSSYVLGKALCYSYKGLSEHTDILLYEKAVKLGIKNINLGGGDDNVVKYKLKFPGAYFLTRYNIKLEKKEETKETKETKGIIDAISYDEFNI